MSEIPREQRIIDALLKLNQASAVQPKELIHSSDPDSHNRYRRGWFAGLTAHLQNGVRGKVFKDDPLFEKRVKAFSQLYKADPNRRGDWTRPSQVHHASRMIEITLRRLQAE